MNVGLDWNLWGPEEGEFRRHMKHAVCKGNGGRAKWQHCTASGV